MSNSTPSSCCHGQTHDSTAKIPKIELKRFDGAIEKWRAYRDWFISTIHNRENLSDANRLDYLQGTLVGEALRTIEAFAATNNNYKEAWKLLEETYDNERVLTLRHYTLLLETPRMKGNTPEEIRALLNRIQTHTLEFKALGEKIENWNTPLFHLIHTRLDNKTLREWNRRQEGKKMPRYETLIEFLREETSRIAPTFSSTQSSNYTRSHNNAQNKIGGHKNQGNHTVNFLTNEALCKLCKKTHQTHKCNELLMTTAPKRIEMIRKASLCLNCLNKGHRTRDCKAKTGEICNKRHHSLLHLNEDELQARRSTNPKMNGEVTS